MSAVSDARAEPDFQRFRLSSLAAITEVGEHCVFTDLLGMRRLVVTAAVAEFCLSLAERPATREEFEARCRSGVAGARIWDLLRDHGLIVPEDANERADLHRLIELTELSDDRGDALKPTWPAYRYWQPRALDLSDFAVERRGEVRVLLLGGCVLQFAQDSLVNQGMRAGLDVSVRHRWPDAWSGLPQLVDEWNPQLTVWQTSVQPVLAGLWDDGPFRSPAERRRQSRALARYVTGRVVELADLLGDRLGLVHSFGPPAVSPFGPADRSMPAGFGELVAELNHVVREAVDRQENLRLVDEELLALRHGAENLFDDLIFPYSHHGGRPDVTINTPNQLPLLSDVLAREYLNAYRLCHGIGRTKCVVVDLDGTLWPGVAADDGFSWLDEDSTTRWMHLGLHQALRLVKERGIHLVSCSKGTESVTMRAWRHAAETAPILSPDDFVLHRINWAAKSDNIADVLDRLGLAPHGALFLDDHPAERAEVRARLPGVRVIDLPVHRFREFLLTDVGCAVSELTDEASYRFDTTRAMLARDELARGMPRDEFLRDLGIRITVRAATVDDAPRVTELVNRTTQCTTTSHRVTRGEALRLLADRESDVVVMSVADRFADYGLVGVVVFERDEVTAFAVSCRVLGLSVPIPFLVTALNLAGRNRPGVTGLLARTDRNEPAWDLFPAAGFRAVADDWFVLADPADLPELADTPYQIVPEPTGQPTR